MQKFIPLYDGVLIIADKPEDKTKGGIIIPDKVAKTLFTGTIYSVGPNVPDTVKEGVKIVFNKMSATPLILNDVEYLFMKCPNIYCFVNPD